MNLASDKLPGVNLLVTGFGPFGSFEANPSSWLAERLGLPHRILPVSFTAVDRFLEEEQPAESDTLLLLGVAGGADKFRIETVARNRIGETPDVDGEQHGPGPIDPSSPPQLAGRLWQHPELLNETEHWRPSVDAGTYLCNYVYYRALQRFPEKRIGFLHVPPEEAMPLERQLEVLRTALQVLES